ncbi:MAG: ParA family protein [Treponema sp.]|nr:ParA family protein [Treponema sp.]
MILTTTNKKGGTGKTTLNILLAEFLYRHGQKVLIIGLDPNCSISEVYGKVLQDQNSKLLLTGRDVEAYLLKEHTSGGTLSIIPEDLDLSMLSNIMDTKLKLEIRRQKFVQKYDYIIIDPPGTWNAQTRNAVFAADTIIVSGKCSPLDYKATLQYMDTLQECCLDSEVFVVCNAYNKQRDPGNIWAQYQQTFKDFLIPEPIPLVNSFQKLVQNPEYSIPSAVEKRMMNFISTVTGKEWV